MVRFGRFGRVDDGKTDLLTLVQGRVLSLDVPGVNQEIVAVVRTDESVTFCFVEPGYGANLLILDCYSGSDSTINR